MLPQNKRGNLKKKKKQTNSWHNYLYMSILFKYGLWQEKEIIPFPYAQSRS